MATTEVTPNVEAVKSELSTYCLVKSTKVVEGKEEEVIQFMTESAAKKAEEKKEGEIVATQSWETYNANSDAGIAELVTSESERVKLFNRGADQKQYQLIRNRMLAQDGETGEYTFQPQEGAISLKADLAKETASRATSPDAKVEKVLDGLSEDEQIKILQKLLAARQVAPTA